MLKAVVTDINSVDEAQRGLYAKGADGLYHLQIEGIDDHQAVVGLRNKRDELLQSTRTLKDRLGIFEGIDPEEHKRLKDLEAQNRLNAVSGDPKKLQEEYERRLEEERQHRKAASEETEKERTAAREYFRQSEINFALSKHGGNPELLAHLIASRTSVDRTEDGKFQLKVMGPDGQPRFKGDRHLSVDDLVTEMKADKTYAGAFAASGISGSGAASGSGGINGSGKKQISWDQLADHIEDVATGKAEVVDYDPHR